MALCLPTVSFSHLTGSQPHSHPAHEGTIWKPSQAPYGFLATKSEGPWWLPTTTSETLPALNDALASATPSSADPEVPPGQESPFGWLRTTAAPLKNPCPSKLKSNPSSKGMQGQRAPAHSVTLKGKLSPLSEPQFSHLCDGDNNSNPQEQRAV